MKQWTPGVARWVGRLGLGWGALAAATATTAALAGTLNIQLGVSNPAERTAFTALAQDFQAANPDVTVKLVMMDLPAYRHQLPGLLDGDSAPDVFNWFGGEQMRTMAQAGQLDDLSEVWKANTWNNTFSTTINASTVGGRQYALPYQYYPWGLFFRHDVLDRVNMKDAPRDLGALITACSKLNKAGFTPIALGAKDGWPLAAWFDYIDLRTNGAQFHQQLTDGKISYQDANVRRAFGWWKQLIDAKCFAPDAVNTDAAGARALWYQGKAGMLLTGTVVSATFPESLKPTLDYARFPVIDPAQAFAEAAPTDLFFVSARAKDKADARKFLKFAASSAANAKLTKALGSFPTNKFAPVPGTVLDLASAKVLSDAKGGLVQAYDRDVPAEMATQAIKAMQDFLQHPDQLNAILSRLDAARAASYHAEADVQVTTAKAGKH